jgi:hypothetical protein
MNIDRNTKLMDIQNAFNTQFPNLRIEFYKQPHKRGEASLEREKLDNELTLQEIGKVPSSGKLEIDGNMKINALESILQNEFGLYAQVFRRSTNLWLQTTTTDEWTLDKAEQKGGRSVEVAGESQEEEPELPGQETE